MTTLKNKNKEVRKALESSTKTAVEAITNIKIIYSLNLQNYFYEY